MPGRGNLSRISLWFRVRCGPRSPAPCRSSLGVRAARIRGSVRSCLKSLLQTARDCSQLRVHLARRAAENEVADGIPCDLDVAAARTMYVSM